MDLAFALTIRIFHGLSMLQVASHICAISSALWIIISFILYLSIRSKILYEIGKIYPYGMPEDGQIVSKSGPAIWLMMSSGISELSFERVITFKRQDEDMHIDRYFL